MKLRKQGHERHCHFRPETEWQEQSDRRLLPVPRTGTHLSVRESPLVGRTADGNMTLITRRSPSCNIISLDRMNTLRPVGERPSASQLQKPLQVLHMTAYFCVTGSSSPNTSAFIVHSTRSYVLFGVSSGLWALWVVALMEKGEGNENESLAAGEDKIRRDSLYVDWTAHSHREP